MKRRRFATPTTKILSAILSQIPLSLLLHGKVRAQFTTPWAEGTCVIDDVATIQGIECLVGNILNIAISAIGLAAAVMFVVGSFLLLTSGGNPKGTDAAKKTISYAIMGLIVALSAWIILNFVSVFTGNTSILQFGILEQNQ